MHFRYIFAHQNACLGRESACSAGSSGSQLSAISYGTGAVPRRSTRLKTAGSWNWVSPGSPGYFWRFAWRPNCWMPVKVHRPVTGPQMRGTGGTLIRLGERHRDRGHPPISFQLSATAREPALRRSTLRVPRCHGRALTRNKNTSSTKIGRRGVLRTPTHRTKTSDEWGTVSSSVTLPPQNVSLSELL